MDRRAVLSALLGLAAFAPVAKATAQTSTFNSLLAQLESDPTLVEDAWQFREQSIVRGVGTGTPSTRTISPQAIEMIIMLEVSSPQRYERNYTHPIWPKGDSGVTIGIGYDLRFASEVFLERDWSGLLDQAMIAKLKPMLGLRGEAARDAVAEVQSVSVPWDAARKQFALFLPYTTKEAENLFANSGDLSDDSFGALVSLVYNRGSGVGRNDDRRSEMREVRDLMRRRDFQPIPEKIREMKRLWPSANQRGLVLRRELEATLFEIGLAQTLKSAVP